MYVVDVRVNPTKYQPGEQMTVSATIQKDPLDLGSYDLEVFIKRENDPAYAWESVKRQSGWMSANPFQGRENITFTDITAPINAGNYLIGVLDTYNIGSTQGNTVDEVLRYTSAIRKFRVDPPLNPLKCRLTVHTYPADAEVFLNDNRVNPWAIPDLDPGIYQVTVKKLFHKTATEMVTLRAGDSVEMEFILEPQLGTEDIMTVVMYAGAGLLLVGGVYVLINRSARAKAIAVGKTALEHGRVLGGQAYQVAGGAYGLAGDLYTQVRDR